MNSISSVDFKNKTVFIRCDFNCPMNTKGDILDDFRIKSSIPTLKFIVDKVPKNLVIITHLGRPKNKHNSKLSTKKLIPILSEYLNCSISFIKEGLDYNFNQLEKSYTSDNFIKTCIYLLENVRFHDYETMDIDSRNKVLLNRNLSIFSFKADVFCNEAFSVSHRDHFSVSGIKYTTKCFGKCFLKELNSFDKVMYPNENDKILAIIGGSKVSDKIPMLLNLSKQVDYIFIAGNNVNAYVKDKHLLDQFLNNKAEIIIMNDGFGGIHPEGTIKYFSDVSDLPDDHSVFDIGPISVNYLLDILNKVNIVFWNGTLGISEHHFYKNGSEMLLKILNNFLSEKNSKPLDVIIGGGDTAGFVNNYRNNFLHISTGGGAAIEYIGNKTLPAI